MPWSYGICWKFGLQGSSWHFEEIESASAMFKRFAASAMSLGSLSPEAHQTITAAMNLLGGRSNTGEGGEDRAVYRKPVPITANQGLDGAASSALAVGGGGTATLVAEAPVATDAVSLNNKIKQVASGRFGVTAEYLAHADEIRDQGSSRGKAW